MKHFILIFALLLSAMSVSAQQANLTVAGTVHDQYGPLVGTTVSVKDNPALSTVTDANGKFSIKAKRGDILVFTFVGYNSVEYQVLESKTDVEIHFTESSTEIEEVVVTAMGKQRKISSLAAVTTVDTKQLERPATSIANLLGGRVAGIITTQISGEPGKNIAEFWVRGIGTFGASSGALVLIDGLEGDINTIDPSDIESFSVLKDASATAVYGVRGANGVVIITTKRGEVDRLQLTARAAFTISQIRRLPEYLRANDYAILANEAKYVRNEEPLYTNVEMDIIKYGLDRDIYPDMDWQDEVIRKGSFSQRYYVSARGGAKAARYFVSLGANVEQAAYEVDKKSLYSSNVGYNTYNYRMNIDLSLTPTTEVYIGSDGFLSVQNEPGVANTNYIWRSQSEINPLLLPAQYSNGQFPGVGQNAGSSPYVLINHLGKRSNQAYKGLFTMELKQDLSMITEGLRIRAQGAYNMESYFDEMRLIQPALYEAVGRTQQGDLVTIERVAEQAASYGKGQNQFRKYHFETTLTYDRVFNDDHRTSALVYYYMSDQKKASESNSNMTSIPKRYQGLSSRFTYGFRDTYMLDFNFGYTGSENFEPGNQYGFFPSLALGWVPTNYSFVQDKLPFLNMLKLRGSIGTVGQDRLTGDRRFPYLTMVQRITAFPFGSYGVEGLVENFTGADNLLWEKATKMNIGVDGELFNNKLSFVLDFFKDKRDRIFQQRVQVPYYVGLSTMPYSNVGAMESFGADGNISFTHDFNNDMGFTFRGNFTYANSNIKNWEEANPKYPYQEISGYPNGIHRGYQALGLFKNQHDIDTSPVQTFGSVMPGDIKYRDVNGDGRIDGDDRVPLSNGTMPTLVYGFGGEFRYKQFTLGVLFKGNGKTDFYHVGQYIDGHGVTETNGMGYIPFHGGQTGNVLTMVNNPKNRWIPMDYAIEHGIDPSLAENPNARFPRLYYGYNSNNSQFSDFWKSDARFLRLQEVTLNYNMKNKFLNSVGVASIDFQLVGNNLLLWDKVKTFDPEQAQFNGRAYPIPTTYTLQLYIHF